MKLAATLLLFLPAFAVLAVPIGGTVTTTTTTTTITAAIGVDTVDTDATTGITAERDTAAKHPCQQKATRGSYGCGWPWGADAKKGQCTGCGYNHYWYELECQKCSSYAYGRAIDNPDTPQDETKIVQEFAAAMAGQRMGKGMAVTVTVTVTVSAHATIETATVTATETATVTVTVAPMPADDSATTTPATATAMAMATATGVAKH